MTNALIETFKKPLPNLSPSLAFNDTTKILHYNKNKINAKAIWEMIAISHNSCIISYHYLC